MSDELVGKKVRSLVGNLGAIHKTEGLSEVTFARGSEFTVVLRLPDFADNADWYALETPDDEMIYVPAHIDMFEVVE